MTAQELNAIRARCDAATPGPWITCSCDDDSFWGATVYVEQEGHDDEYIAHFSKDQIADAEFIARARADVPALLAALEQAQAERDALAAVFKSHPCVRGLDCPHTEKTGQRRPFDIICGNEKIPDSRQCWIEWAVAKGGAV